MSSEGGRGGGTAPPGVRGVWGFSFLRFFSSLLFSFILTSVPWGYTHGPYDTKTVACGGKGGAGELIRFRQLSQRVVDFFLLLLFLYVK